MSARRADPDKAKRPPWNDERLKTIAEGAILASSCPGNGDDITTAYTEVIEFAVAHPAEFGDRLTILAPIVEGACYIHDNPLSEGFRRIAASPWRFVPFDDADICLSGSILQRQDVISAM